MHPFLILFIIILSLYVLFFGVVYICYAIVFKTNKLLKRQKEYYVPIGKSYRVHKEQLIAWQKEAKSIPCEKIAIKSFDGLTLRGKFYEYEKGAPIEIMFHGWRGNAERDLSGGIQRCFALKRSALLIDQRGQSSSDGFTITFGVKERYDAISWANYVYDRFGDSVPIILTGISMGASTVLLASELDLPKTVKGVIADCGYSSAKKIIKKVIKQLYFPAFLFYPIIRLGAKLYGGFDIESADCEKALQNAKVPVIFIHGTTDGFVPYSMSEDNFNACVSDKDILFIDGAGHGLAYIIDPKLYIEKLKQFNKKINL